MGNRRRRRPEHETDASLGTVVGATLGLLAFMLAFAFGVAAERLQARKQLLLDEVNAIGTTYLRAGLLLEPHQREMRRLLREHVDLRANPAREDLSRIEIRGAKLADVTRKYRMHTDLERELKWMGPMTEVPERLG